MKRLLSQLTYANVISTMALILALGGATAFAASGGGSSPAKLKLCAAKKGGDLRLLSGAGSCKPSEQALTVDSRGTEGVAGAAGPAGAPGERGPQGERGPAGPSLASPDGRFTVVATNAGIVLAGPNGATTFDGEKILSDGDLEIAAPQKLTLANGTALDITSGVTTTFTTGVNFTQIVGGAYDQTVGGGYNQLVGAGYTQSVGAGYSQSVANGYTETIGGAYGLSVGNGYTETIGGAYNQSVAGASKQQVNSTYRVDSGGAAQLAAPTLTLGGNPTCPAAARVGSEVDGFLRVTAAGSSSKVFVC
jgi:hypothetical protein